MDQKQTFQKRKLGDRIIRSQNCLKSLLAADPDPNMGHFDHRNVVCPVANRESDGFFVSFHQIYH